MIVTPRKPRGAVSHLSGTTVATAPATPTLTAEASTNGNASSARVSHSSPYASRIGPIDESREKSQKNGLSSVGGRISKSQPSMSSAPRGEPRRPAAQW